MATVREIMTSGCECAQMDDTLVDVASRLRDLDIGSMPICGDDEKLAGMITDRDIVVKAIAEGRNPADVRVRELATGKPVWVDADAAAEEAEGIMSQHQVRRLPVIESHRLVGIITQADIARRVPADQTGQVVRDVSEPNAAPGGAAASSI
jgi:CBS domain-containing protein